MDEKIANATDSATGLPVFSLYGDTRNPTDEMLKGIDALVFDMQDAGVRFYTFTSTMGYSMEAAAKHKIPFFVLDRPNPLGGERIEGPMLDKGRISFTGYFSMPIVYGMTMGELARMFNAENKTNAELHVVAMKDWRRGETYDETMVERVRLHCAPLREAGVDTVILGCTHYPLVAPMLQRALGRGVTLVTSGAGVARSVERALTARGLLNPRSDEGTYRFSCTGDVEAFRAVGTRFLQMPLGEVTHVELGTRVAA